MVRWVETFVGALLGAVLWLGAAFMALVALCFLAVATALGSMAAAVSPPKPKQDGA